MTCLDRALANIVGVAGITILLLNDRPWYACLFVFFYCLIILGIYGSDQVLKDLIEQKEDYRQGSLMYKEEAEKMRQERLGVSEELTELKDLTALISKQAGRTLTREEIRELFKKVMETTIKGLASTSLFKQDDKHRLN